MSEMSWQLRHPDYGLMRIALEETTAREGWTGKYLDSTRSLFTSTVDGTTRKLSYIDTDDSAYSVEFLRGNSDDNAPEDADRVELHERRGYIVPEFRGQGARVMFAAVGKVDVDKRLHRVNLWTLLLQTALTFIAATLVIDFFPKFFEKLNDILVPSFLNAESGLRISMPTSPATSRTVMLTGWPAACLRALVRPSCTARCTACCAIVDSPVKTSGLAPSA